MDLPAVNGQVAAAGVAGACALQWMQLLPPFVQHAARQ
jgi:hypothetical protein